MPTQGAPDPVFDCEGEMATRCAAHDWSTTPLGPPAGWSQSLRTATAVLLRSRFPMILSWGHELVVVYNDPFIPTLGAKHPGALGTLLPDLFAEVWDAVGPMQRSVLAGGPATFHEDLPLLIERGSGLEETFFTFSYSHVPEESGSEGPGGVLAVLAVTTGKVVGARRLALLNDLAGRLVEVTTTQDAAQLALGCLSGARSDLVGGACYLPRAGPAGDDAAAWERAEDFGATDDPEEAQRLVGRVLDEGRRVVEPLPGTDDGPTARVGIPMRGRDGAAGVLVLVPHPRRPLDEDHLAFLDLVGEHVGQLLSAGRARDEEQARLAALAAIDAAKTAFVSNVSHEFRTPLTLLLGPLEDALTEQDLPDQDDLATMYQSAHRLLRLVNSLLDVARIGAGAGRVEPEATDLVELTQDLLQPFRQTAERAGLRLDAELDPGLGVVETDPHLWETVAINLVANAVKFTPSGWVRVSLSREGSQVVLRVSDSGIGIREEDLDRVFERFHRGTGPEAHTVEGTGLGLALVAEAVEALGGTTRAESQPGEGSTFEVRLPYVPGRGPRAHHTVDTKAAAALAEEVRPVGRQVEAGDTPRPDLPQILVVDDNAAMRDRVRHIVDPLGAVTTCADGVEALETLRRRSFDLVVTDVMMPRLDGLGLLEAIRADEALADLPVVLLSARAGAEAATGALETGADDYVVKPFTRAELLARCRTALELSRLRAQTAAAQARATMLAGVSHDMQTPLSVITSSLSLLTDPAADLDAEHRADLARRAVRRAGQLDRLVRQFLDWSRLSNGVPLVPLLEPTEIGRLVAEVVADYPAAVLGEVSTSVTVTCDRRRTEQVLHNLLSNATRAARDAVEVTMSRPSGPDPRAVQVRVSDDGPGVAGHVLPRLFAPFGPSEHHAGNGLGLHVSREAARAQGGDLWLEHSGAEGSVFVLELASEQ